MLRTSSGAADVLRANRWAGPVPSPEVCFPNQRGNPPHANRVERYRSPWIHQPTEVGAALVLLVRSGGEWSAPGFEDT
jgi:hypothetical protein